MKKQGKKWMLVALALLAVVTVTLPLVGCKNDTVAEQTGGNAEQPATPGTGDQGSGDGNQGTGDGTGSGDGNQGTGDQGSGSGNQGTGDGTGSGSGNQGSGDGNQGTGGETEAGGGTGTGDPEQPVTYTVSFNTYGGGSIDSQTIVSGQTATKPADPTLENNVFYIWYIDETLTSVYDFTTPVTSSFPLYAKWVEGTEVTVDNVSTVISGLTGDGSYILVATGNWSSVHLSAITAALEKKPNAKVNLDLSNVSGLTSIGNHAFSHCSGLTSISIPEGVKSIGNHAFSHCSGLTSISIPSSVTSIGDYAFIGCSGLTSIDLSKATGLTTIGNGAFSGCSGATVKVEAENPPTWDSGVFKDVSKILVPSGFVDTYKEKWSDYEGKIEAIPE